MTSPKVPTADSASAQWAAEQAAARAGVTVTDLVAVPELEAVERLINRTWPAEVSISLLCALVKAGSYVGGATRDGRLVGACIGFFGDRSAAELHSHLAVTAEEVRGAGVGYALKLHQRAWALARGLDRVSWTFDPMERRNAYLNIAKLMALPTEYVPNFYGDHGDGTGRAFPTDRLLVAWQRGPVTPAELVTSPELRGVPIAVGADADGRPREDAAAWHEPVVLVATPENAAALRRTDPGLAAEWRLALRHQLGGAMRDGRHVSGFTRDGYYVLERPSP
jgi:predicted GNAT superfamily acetyltransferase